MKKLFLIAIVFLLATAACEAPDKAISKQDGMYLVDTAQIENEIAGYAGPTPVTIYIKDRRIVKVVMQDNYDGRRYNQAVREGICNAWDGKSLEEAATLEVDAVSGATYTSNAVVENVRLGVTYFMEKRKK